MGPGKAHAHVGPGEMGRIAGAGHVPRAAAQRSSPAITKAFRPGSSSTLMDYGNALMDDFDSDSGLSDAADSRVHSGPAPSVCGDAEARPETLHDLLVRARGVSVDRQLQQMDALGALGALDTSGAPGLSQVQALIPVIRADLEKYADLMETEYMDLVASIHQQDQSAEYRFLVQLSDLPVLVHDEMLALRRFVALRYQVVFPELELLVASPVDYCRVVLEIGQDLAGVRAHEPRLRQIVAADKVLTIVMAALQQFPQAFQLSPGDFAPIAAACHACLELSGFLQEISQFVAGKLGKYAPNVAQVVGPVATAQLLVSTGSLAQLAQTPACNLAALGVRELLSQHKARLAPWVRAPGYLYQSPLVAGLPPEIVRQALRVISAKVVLAARIDLSRSSPDGGMGRAYRDEIRRKIDQLLAPPELTAARALPVPKEQKLKKRGGRRFRKMKERFQMSDLRKAQNKMLFGTQEQTVVDGFGDEVGLGMSRQMDGVLVNRNTDARMSKAMVARLQQQKQRETLDTIVLAPVAEKRARAPDVPGKWGTMKRQRLDGEDRG